MLIKDFIENGADIILTPRPRRFGKTLNLSMLKYFFDIKTKEETKTLFKGLKIENEKEIMDLQGKYPVIFITFKNEKYLTYEDFKDGITFLMINLVLPQMKSMNLQNIMMAQIKWNTLKSGTMDIFLVVK